MCRNMVVPAEVEPPQLCHHHHLAKTVLDQASVCPLLPEHKPVLWGSDHAMWLYPQPQLVVLADRAARYSVPPTEAGGCAVENPGSFYVDFGFTAYTPLTNSAEPCAL